PASEQAQLFIDINHEQRSVKRNLLHELCAELNWDAEDEGKRIGAIVSKAIQALNQRSDSPLFERVLLTDSRRTDTRCISLESLFKSLNQPGIYVVKKGVEYGPLWTGENEGTLRRTIHVVSLWLTQVRGGADDWWDAGAGEGGGLAMNDGVTVCMGVMRSVLQHLAAIGHKLIQLSDDELVRLIRPYGDALGAYLGGLTNEQRQTFRRSVRGVQGQTFGRRQCERALMMEFPDFAPPGLSEAVELQAAGTNKRAYPIIQHIEKMLHAIIIDALKAEFGEDDLWWYGGIPQPIRKKVVTRVDEDQGKGGREDYFDLVDYREIALANWSLVRDILAFEGKGNKRKKTHWMGDLNDMRRIVMHSTRSRVIQLDQLARLERYERCLVSRLDGSED
ncbi:hypothetical protein KAW64_14460, partial [bacterium]|nr:hypothetical protein [bacterium]